MMIQSIDLLIKVIVAFSVLLIGFTIYLAIKRTWQVSEQKRVESYVNEKQASWYRYLIGKEALTSKLVPKKKYEFIGIEQIFLAYVNNISHSAIQEKIKRFSNEYLQQYYKRNLESRKWSNRMNALYRINDFQVDSLLASCKQLEERKLSNEEYFLLLKLYSFFDVDTFITKLLTSSITFSEYEYKKLFLQINTDTEEILKDHFDKLRPVCQYAFIEVLGIKREMETLSFLEGQLKSEDSEIRIRSLKSIYEMGIISNLATYLPFATSTVWEERLMCAKLLGNLPLEETLLLLKELIKDRNWWVRLQAAETIGKYRSGKEVLKEIAESMSDLYAIDMANEILRKGF